MFFYRFGAKTIIVLSLGKPNTLLSWYCLDRGMWMMVIENCIVSSYTIRQVDKWRGVIVKDEDMSGDKENN